MNRLLLLVFVALNPAPGIAQTQIEAQSTAMAERLAEYRQQGAGDFDAGRGEALWNKAFENPANAAKRSCATCHDSALDRVGRHVETGKIIDPMHPAVTLNRLSDARKIEKWFLRNCTWTFGRECTPQEKGDFLMFINQ